MTMRFFALALFTFIALAPAALAQSVNSGGSVVPGGPQSGGTVIPAPPQNTRTDSITLINPLKGVDCSRGNGNCLESFLLNILDFVIRIGSIIVVLMVVYIGYMFVRAQGVPGKIEEARKALLWTVVGALILLGAQAIAMAVKATVQALSVGG